MNTLRIRVFLNEMASSKLREMIPQEVIDEIKKTDRNPIFRGFVVAQEGPSFGNVVGIGNTLKTWTAGVIKSLHDKIAVGLQGLRCFLGHGPSNEIAPDRQVIGRVVAKAIMPIEGLVSSVCAIYLDPLFSAMKLDLASIEGLVDLEIDKQGNVMARDVSEISGLALGSSSVEKAGFPGAGLVAEVQAFVQAFALENKVGDYAPEIKIDGTVEGDPYLDPKINKFIRLSTEDAPNQPDDKPLNPYLDPSQNPMIKLD